MRPEPVPGKQDSRFFSILWAARKAVNSAYSTAPGYLFANAKNRGSIHIVSPTLPVTDSISNSVIPRSLNAAMTNS
jgi:hypothetical protein